MRKYQERGTDDPLPFQSLIALVDQVSGIRALMGQPKDARTVGKLLRVTSFACCIYGGPATSGDLDEYIRRIEEVNEFTDEMRPRDFLECHYAGQSLYLQVFLYDMLRQSLQGVEQIRLERGYDPSSLREEDERTWKIPLDVLSTNYHLHRSIVQCLETTCGHA